MKRIVEIVCCSAEDCGAASRSGAGRIELCSAIKMGGLTPSSGLLKVAKTAVGLPIMAMIRPCPGGFCYSDLEFETMLADCEALAPADGFVFGALTPDRAIDRSRCTRLVQAAGDRDKVFHRAFDAVADPFAAIELLIDLGFTRVLTSGLAQTAMEGREMLCRLIEAADGRIEVMPGGGVRSSNVRAVATVDCPSVHLAPLRQPQPASDAPGHFEIDEQEVRAVVQAFH